MKIIDINVGLNYFCKRSQVQKFTVQARLPSVGQGYKKLAFLFIAGNLQTRNSWWICRWLSGSKLMEVIQD